MPNTLNPASGNSKKCIFASPQYTYYSFAGYNTLILGKYNSSYPITLSFTGFFYFLPFFFQINT